MNSIAQASAPPTGGKPGELEINSVFDFLVKGGWFMVPIGLCSLVAVAIIAERLVIVRRRRVVPPAFIARLKDVGDDREQALKVCRASNSPIARVLEVAIRRENESEERQEKLVEEAGAREVVALRSHMRLLSTLPQVSTMLGLLGTVFGMIKTFQAVAGTSEALGKTEMLAKGIFEAWTCTAGGLLVAIPVMVMYHYLMGKIDGIVALIDRTALDWLENHKPRYRLDAKVVESKRVSENGQAASPAVAVTAA